MKTVKASDLIGFKDLEGLTRIPGSTLRRYVERFPQFLPGKTVDRVQRFSPEVVGVLNRVHALYQEGKRTEEVAGILALEAVATYDLPPVTTDTTTVSTPPEAQGEALAYLGPILERFAVALERIAGNGTRQAAAVEARLTRLEALSGDLGGVLPAEGSSPDCTSKAQGGGFYGIEGTPRGNHSAGSETSRRGVGGRSYRHSSSGGRIPHPFATGAVGLELPPLNRTPRSC